MMVVRRPRLPPRKSHKLCPRKLLWSQWGQRKRRSWSLARANKTDGMDAGPEQPMADAETAEPESDAVVESEAPVETEMTEPENSEEEPHETMDKRSERENEKNQCLTPQAALIWVQDVRRVQGCFKPSGNCQLKQLTNHQYQTQNTIYRKLVDV